jgi:hypothetical protein
MKKKRFILLFWLQGGDNLSDVVRSSLAAILQHHFYLFCPPKGHLFQTNYAPALPP